MTNLNRTSTTKLVPKCLSANKEYAYSATRYILPCCYADNKDFSGFESLMKEHLLVDNVKDIEKNIISSEEWKMFFTMLVDSPDNAPITCKYYCGNSWNTKKRTIKKNI